MVRNFYLLSSTVSRWLIDIDVYTDLSIRTEHIVFFQKIFIPSNPMEGFVYYNIVLAVVLSHHEQNHEQKTLCTHGHVR